MSGYARVLSKINETVWLITPEGLNTILRIVDDRIANGKLDDDEIMAKLAGENTHMGMFGMGPKEDGKRYSVINGAAILPVAGPIFGKANLMTMMSGATSLESFQQDFRAAMADPAVKSVIMEFDSPGGSSELLTEVGQEIYDARGKKPIYSSVNAMCGSAALWLASQADEIVVTPSGYIGSLGAYTVHTDQSGADAQRGVKHTFIKAGKYKTEGNPHEPLSADAIAHRQEVVNKAMEGFIGAVAKGRNLKSDYVSENFGEGRMLDAETAVSVGMADEVLSFDGLLNKLSNSNPQMVQVYVPGQEAPIAASMINGVIALDGSFGSIRTSNNTHTSYTPNPRFIPVPVKNGREDNDMPFSPALLTALGLPEDATEEQAVAAITSLNTQVTELAPLKELRDSIETTSSFAKMFPDEHKRMQSLELDNKKLEAKTFAGAYRNARFSDIKIEKDGDDDKEVAVKTTLGLSGLALNLIEDNSLKVITGEFKLSDFKDTVDAMLCGRVDYGTKGSDVGEEPTLSEGIKPSGTMLEIRNQFANLVNEVMVKDELAQDAAITLVAQKNPDLWAAYKNSAPVAA